MRLLKPGGKWVCVDWFKGAHTRRHALAEHFRGSITAAPWPGSPSVVSPAVHVAPSNGSNSHPTMAHAGNNIPQDQEEGVVKDIEKGMLLPRLEPVTAYINMFTAAGGRVLYLVSWTWDDDYV